MTITAHTLAFILWAAAALVWLIDARPGVIQKTNVLSLCLGLAMAGAIILVFT